MATVVDLTQVQVAQTTPLPNGQISGLYWVPDSAKPLSIDQTSIVGVGYFWDQVGKRILDGVVVVYISNVTTAPPILVTDSYTTIKGYITANP